MSNYESHISTLDRHPPAEGEAYEMDYLEKLHSMKEVIEVPGEPECHLRHVTLSDAPQLAEIVERNVANFSKGLGEWVFETDVCTMQERIHSMLALSSQERGMAYCIMDSPLEAPGKVIGLNRLFKSHHRLRDGIEVSKMHCGFWLDSFARGYGVVPRTSIALFKYAQERWGVDQIYMDIAQNNEAAIRCARNMGAVTVRLASWDLEQLNHSPILGISRTTVAMDKWLMQLPQWQHPTQPQEAIQQPYPNFQTQ